MKSVAVFVTELEHLTVDVYQFHFVGRAKANIGALAGVDVTDDCLDKGAQISRRTVMHFEHDGGVAIVLNRHSFAEIVGCGHLERKVKGEVRK